MSGSAPLDRPWPRLSPGRRFGPPILVVLLLAVLAGTATVAGHDDPGPSTTGPPVSEVRGYAELPTLPVTYEDARAAGTLDRYGWGEHCDPTRPYNDTDRTLARVAIPTVYAPPCVPAWGGTKPWRGKDGKVVADNGGATAPGVTADEITVVYYLPAEQDITKQLEQFGVTDPPDVQVEAVADLVEMSNHLYETYGRRVRLVPFHATGDGRSPASATADAVRVAEMGAFASIGGPTQTSAYQHELARNQILCLQCGFASTDDVLGGDAPYAWGYLATPDQLLYGTFGYGSELLYGKPAEFAGDPEMRTRTRRFGIVHYEQDPPIFGPLRAEATADFAREGRSVDTIIQYVLDPNSLNAQAQAIIGRLKREGITSVVYLGDPLMPRLLTQQATRQDYHPEWIFTGTAFTDTTAVARLYDPGQMRHAFGASSITARMAPEVSEPWRMHEWWFGTEPVGPHTLFSWGPVVQMLYLGIHMAGPVLTAETFAGGLFNYPPTGGTDIGGKDGLALFTEGYLSGDTTPAISWGFHVDQEEVDYVAVDDFTSTWWDADARGPDENDVEGKGMWQYTGSGLRIHLDDPQVPPGVNASFLFSRTVAETEGELAELAVAVDLGDLPIASTILEAVPPLDAVPDYPTRPDSPAADD